MLSSESQVHDEMLFSMLKDCKSLPVFLDHIFGFLQRRTDFYHVANDVRTPVGLPKGLAESMLRHSFLKWIPSNQDETTILQEYEVPRAVFEEEVISEVVGEEVIDSVDNISLTDASSNSTPQITQLEPEIKSPSDFTVSDSYNGAVFKNYCWSQTIGEVDIIVKLPENSLSKHLKVTITLNRISVKVKDTTLLEGQLCQNCKHNNVIWSVDRGKLQIHLDKCKEIWWNCLVTSEDRRLDLSKIDCSRPFDDLPEDAQAKVEELGWNQERRRLGLPTSDELAKRKILEQAWHADGSPFSGPFDPNQVVFH